jgi:hypothetical protein
MTMNMTLNPKETENEFVLTTTEKSSGTRPKMNTVSMKPADLPISQLPLKMESRDMHVYYGTNHVLKGISLLIPANRITA